MTYEHACEHLTTDCAIVRRLSGQSVMPHSSACDWCSHHVTPPREVNEVTVSLALAAVRSDANATALITDQYGHLVPAIVESRARRDEHSQRLHAVMHGHGVGSQMWRLLESLGVNHTPDCECLATAEQLNAWGPAGCRLVRAEIVERMRINAKSYGWATVATAAGRSLQSGLAWRLDLTNVYGSLLDEAIRLAEVFELSQASPDPHALSSLPAS